MVISTGTLNRIRKDLFDHMQSLPVSFFDTHTHGELMSRFTNDTDTLREFLSQSLTQALSSALSLIAMLALMLMLSPLLTLILLLLMPLSLFVVKFIGKRSGKYFAAQQKAVGAVNGLRLLPTLGVLQLGVLLFGLGLGPPLFALRGGTYAGVAGVERPWPTFAEIDEVPA